MKPAPHCATPELMALLCLMGGAVREAMAAHLLVQLMLVGVLNPAFGAVFKTWLHAEERAHAAGDAAAWYDLGEDDDPQDDPEDDPQDDFDETRIVPFGRTGLALVWRHVTRFGTVMVVKLAEMSDEHPASVPEMRLGCVALAGLSGPSQFLFFWLGLADGKTCVLIVPCS